MAERMNPSHIFRQSPLTVVGGLILLSVVLACALAPVLAPADPIKTGFSGRLRPPVGLGGVPTHIMGTDNLGRDIWARVLYGGRFSLGLAAGAVILAAGAGVLLGL